MMEGVVNVTKHENTIGYDPYNSNNIKRWSHFVPPSYIRAETQTVFKIQSILFLLSSVDHFCSHPNKLWAVKASRV